MDSTGKIWVALDCDKTKAMGIAKLVASHPAVLGFKVNRLVHQEVYRQDGEPRLFQELKKLGKPVFIDVKLHDIPRTVVGSIEAHLGSAAYVTVMSEGGVPMMRDAVNASSMNVIAVTMLTSLSNEEVVEWTGRSRINAVTFLAEKAVEAGIKFLVCSGNELTAIKEIPEIAGLQCFIPAVKPAFSVAGRDQKQVTTPEMVFQCGGEAVVIGSAIVGANDPLEAVKMIADEIEAIEI